MKDKSNDTPAPQPLLVGDDQPRYTTKRLHDEIAKARAYGIEMAAALVDEMIDDDCMPLANRHRISKAIRALASAEVKNG